MKPGFEHHGRLTSETARKMLSMRGGRNSAAIASRDGYKRLLALQPLALLVRKRKACIRRLAELEALCQLAYGMDLLTYLLTEQARQPVQPS